jgi:hypothetical protein
MVTSGTPIPVEPAPAPPSHLLTSPNHIYSTPQQRASTTNENNNIQTVQEFSLQQGAIINLWSCVYIMNVIAVQVFQTAGRVILDTRPSMSLWVDAHPCSFTPHRFASELECLDQRIPGRQSGCVGARVGETTRISERCFQRDKNFFPSGN